MTTNHNSATDLYSPDDAHIARWGLTPEEVRAIYDSGKEGHEVPRLAHRFRWMGPRHARRLADTGSEGHPAPAAGGGQLDASTDTTNPPAHKEKLTITTASTITPDDLAHLDSITARTEAARMTLPETNKPQADKPAPDLLALARSAAMPLSGIRTLNIPPRSPILPPWLMESALGFIYGARGLGKTWFSYHLALCLASGRDFGPWKCEAPQPVLYLDGEMSLSGRGTMDRLTSLMPEPPDNLRILHHEVLFHQSERSVNIADPEWQAAITALCIESGTKVLIADNLSCLAGGVRENEGDDWAGMLLPWALELRRRRIALVLVHHAGRNGQMRGSSRREDPADFIIRLSPPPGKDEAEADARFIMAFEKNRGADVPCPPLEWTFKRMPDGVQPVHKAAGLQDMILELVANGLDSCGEIAEAIGQNQVTVSRAAIKLINANKLIKEGRRYRLPDVPNLN